MKLVGFNEHYIEKIDFSFISQEEMDSILKPEQVGDIQSGEIQIGESVEVGIAEGLRNAKITAEIRYIDIEDLRKIDLTIIGFFEIDNEGEEDGRTLTDFVYDEGWQLLNQYVKPTISTILHISNTNNLDTF
ncbi:hypothetical protein ACH434_23050 [Lysinibacillus fusiformis]|uniref:hypothetical protein n=1 Tax=Lysinibacillus fusiformis TaxID=28031 RepID=UPI00378950B6